jgi:glycosyltransferase involved in cell wall biosynthesis
MSADRSIWGVHDFQLDPAKSTRTELRGTYTGCGWYRIVSPLNALAEHGWRVGYRHGTPPAEAEDYRIVMAQRTDRTEAMPHWRRMRLTHRLVYDTDDNPFDTNESARDHQFYSQASTQETITHAVEVADILTVSTEPLAEVFRARTSQANIHVLPNYMPEEILGFTRLRHHRRLVVGWCGGNNHVADIAMVTGQVAGFLDSNPHAELHLRGTDFSRAFGRPKQTRFYPWIDIGPNLDYYRALDFDIALAPLTGTKFDASKSNIKALEPMCLGIPVIASDAEPYRGLVIDGVNGYLVRKSSDWGRRLRELAADPQAREEMGAKARETARAWTIEGNWHKWSGLFEGLL